MPIFEFAAEMLKEIFCFCCAHPFSTANMLVAMMTATVDRILADWLAVDFMVRALFVSDPAGVPDAHLAPDSADVQGLNYLCHRRPCA